MGLGTTALTQCVLTLAARVTLGRFLKGWLIVLPRMGINMGLVRVSLGFRAVKAARDLPPLETLY